VVVPVVEYGRLNLLRVCGTTDDDSDGIIRGYPTDDCLRIIVINRSVRFNTLLSDDRFRQVFIIILSICLFVCYLLSSPVSPV